MCYHCSSRSDKYFIRQNKDSCFLCGGYLHPYNSKNAHYCTRHSKNNPVHYKCYVCNGIYPIKTPALPPILAKLCFFCGLDRSCCFINTD